MKSTRRIEVIGADANNLADVNLEIRINALTAVIGVSGSGKSSLVDDTLAAEAAVRMRRFLDIDIGASAQDVRAFVGELPPTLLVGQRAFRASSRTTVATSTSLLRELPITVLMMNMAIRAKASLPFGLRRVLKNGRICQLTEVYSPTMPKKFTTAISVRIKVS